MPAIRTAVLADENGKWLGAGVRLSGGGIGIIFSRIEPLVCDQLRPI